MYSVSTAGKRQLDAIVRSEIRRVACFEYTRHGEAAIDLAVSMWYCPCWHVYTEEVYAMNMFLNIVVPAACAVVMCVTPAFAQDHIQYYDHNGSLMKMVWDQEVGEYFEMFYEVPRRGLKVKPGTFFMGGGEPAGGAVYAYPRTFKKGCAPAEYKVTGRFDEAGNLRLGGRAPIRKGCKVVGYATTDNSWLEFTRLN